MRAAQIAGGLLDQPQDQFGIDDAEDRVGAVMAVAALEAGKPRRIEFAQRIEREAIDIGERALAEVLALGKAFEPRSGVTRCCCGTVGSGDDARRERQEFGAEFVAFGGGQASFRFKPLDVVAGLAQDCRGGDRAAHVEEDPDFGQLEARALVDQLVRQAVQPFADPRDVAQANERHGTGFDQRGREGAVARGQRVLHGVARMALLRQPFRRLAVQGRDALRVALGKQRTQEIGEEVVVTEPNAFGIERDQEEVRRFDFFQHRGGIGMSGEVGAQRCGDAVENCGFQQEEDRLLRQPTQHVMGEEFGDAAVGAGEAADDGGAVGLGPVVERDRGKLQAGDPALGAVLQADDIGALEAKHARAVQEAFGFGEREAERLVVDADHLALHAHRGELQRHETARGENEMERRGRIGQQRIEEAGDLGRGEDMAVVEHEEEIAAARGKVVHQRGEDRIDGKDGAGADERGDVLRDGWIGPRDGGDEIVEEAAEVIVGGIEREPSGGGAARGEAGRPLRQQGALAEACGGRDHRELRPFRRIELPQQRVAVDEAALQFRRSQFGFDVHAREYIPLPCRRKA